jgi:hypothetical protein
LVDLDTLGSVDKEMPMWQIPVNKNAPYTPEKIRPAVSYEDETNVTNPCQVEDLNNGDSGLQKVRITMWLFSIMVQALCV